MAKNLIVCCDGTWNTPEQREGGLPCPTNVVKLHNLSLEDESQRRYYHPGVGTNGGVFDKVLGGGVGVGISQNIKSAYEWLCRNYATGDRIFLFGFSRGAFTARSLGGFVARCGLLDLSSLTDAEAWDHVAYVYDKGYRPPKPPTKWPKGYSFIPGPLVGGKVDIHMIGVWDTVGALGVPDDLVLLDQLFDDARKYRFHDTRLSPVVLHARHAVAMDEVRASFAPTLWDEGTERPADGSFKQQWFAGVHSDVGGGYAETGLSDGALKWMVDEAIAVGLKVNPALLAQVQPNPRGVLHDSASGVWELLRTLPRATPPLLPSLAGSVLSAQVIERHTVPPLSQAPYWPTRTLSVGDEVTLDVFARPHWNATGIYLEAGATYGFSASGEWLDADIACGPDGPKKGVFQLGQIAQVFGNVLGELEQKYKDFTEKAGSDWWGTKRVESADWFQLIGMVANQPNADASGTPTEGEFILIGRQAIHTPSASGYLYGFANDAWKFYGNNRGKVSLTIKRVK